jgi:hypothetical protein
MKCPTHIHQFKERPPLNSKICYICGVLKKQTYDKRFTLAFREKVRQRDGYKCMWCDKKQSELKKKLHIHHIDYNKKNSRNYNCISLCDNCHLKTNGTIDKRIDWFERFAKIMNIEYGLRQNLIKWNNREYLQKTSELKFDLKRRYNKEPTKGWGLHNRRSKSAKPIILPEGVNESNLTRYLLWYFNKDLNKEETK